MYDRFKELGIPVGLTRDRDVSLDPTNRVNKILNAYGNNSDVIVISNALISGGEGAEIVYALRNSNALAQKIANELEKTGQNVSKYYQRRLPSNTALDYNQLIRDTANNETLIIYYGNTDNTEDLNNIINNPEELGEAVVIALLDYLNLDYTPTENGKYYKVVAGDTIFM